MTSPHDPVPHVSATVEKVLRILEDAGVDAPVSDAIVILIEAWEKWIRQSK